MRRSRILQTSLAAAVLLFAGAKAFSYARQRKASPFVLWEFRAGSSFKKLEESAYRQTKQRFTCHAVVATTRLCEMRVTGIGGLVRVLVDARERVTVVQFMPDTASPAMREEGRRVAAEWNLVRAGVSAKPEYADSGVSVTRWRSEDGKWTAMMRYGRLGSTPVFVHLGDESALAAIGASAPLASFALGLNGIVESRDVPNVDDVSEVIRTTMYDRATDPANESPSPSAASAMSLCEPERADPIVEAPEGSGDPFGASRRALLERAVPAVYPGARLVFGNGTWLVDSTGRSERIMFAHGDFAGGGPGTVLNSVTLPGRFSVAMQRIEDAVPDRLCRAPGMLLFAREDGDSSLADAHLISVDHEAVASDIVTIHLTEPGMNGEPGHIRVRYTSAYVGQGWSGSVDWTTFIEEDPPRTTVRVPLAFTQPKAGGEEARHGFLVVTGRPKGGIELSTIEQTSWGFTTRTVTVPVDSTGVLLGARILERLAALSPSQ